MSISSAEPVGYAGMFGTTPTATTDPGASTTTTGSSTADKDMFLQLLVAQMKYQDPMNPTDSSQFLAQSAQFTALEKMQDVADRTAQLVSSQMAFGASGLVGRYVSWTGTDGVLQSGQVSGVQFGTDGPMLEVGGTTLPLARVQTVRDSATAPVSTGAGAAASTTAGFTAAGAASTGTPFDASAAAAPLDTGSDTSPLAFRPDSALSYDPGRGL